MPSTQELAERYGSAYRWLVTAAILLGLTAMTGSVTIVNVAMPDIMGEFGLGQDQVQLISTSYLAAMTASMLMASWVVETFGTRNAYIMTQVGFILGSMIAGFSPDGSFLIFARVLQGVSAGVATPLGMVTIFQAFPPDRRGTAMGIYEVGMALAPAVAPAIGGMLIDNFNWRFVFAIAPPLCVPAIVLALVFLPAKQSSNAKAENRSFDLLGFGLLSIGITFLLTGLSNGQRIGWDSTFVRGSFLVAAIAAVAFVIQERRTKTPILALEVFSNPRFVASSAVAFIIGVGLYGSTYLVPLFVQTLQGYMPTTSGLLLLPAGVVLAVIFPTCGRLADVVPPYLLIACGAALFGLSNFLMSGADPSTAFWTFAWWVVIGRIALGLILPSLNAGSLSVLDHRLVRQGAGAVSFCRQLGGAIGVNALSIYLERQTTFYATEFNALQTGTAADNNALRRIAGMLRRAGLSDNPHVTLRTQEAYRFLSRMIEAQASVFGYRACFLLVAMIFFAAVFPAWFMRPPRRSAVEISGH